VALKRKHDDESSACDLPYPDESAEVAFNSKAQAASSIDAMDIINSYEASQLGTLAASRAAFDKKVQQLLAMPLLDIGQQSIRPS
jgi:hypothetical protein